MCYCFLCNYFFAFHCTAKEQQKINYCRKVCLCNSTHRLYGIPICMFCLYFLFFYDLLKSGHFNLGLLLEYLQHILLITAIFILSLSLIITPKNSTYLQAVRLTARVTNPLYLTFCFCFLPAVFIISCGYIAPPTALTPARMRNTVLL